MYIWSILWFWFKLEFIVDVDTNKSFYLSLFPNITYTRSYKDGIGCRKHQFSFVFLNISINLHYYYPSNYFFNQEGEFIGTRSYPNVFIETINFEDNIS